LGCGLKKMIRIGKAETAGEGGQLRRDETVQLQISRNSSRL
jgi:hypothetical protein